MEQLVNTPTVLLDEYFQVRAPVKFVNLDFGSQSTNTFSILRSVKNRNILNARNRAIFPLSFPHTIFHSDSIHTIYLYFLNSNY